MREYIMKRQDVEDFLNSIKNDDIAMAKLVDALVDDIEMAATLLEITGYSDKFDVNLFDVQWPEEQTLATIPEGINEQDQEPLQVTNSFAHHFSLASNNNSNLSELIQQNSAYNSEEDGSTDSDSYWSPIVASSSTPKKNNP